MYSTTLRKIACLTIGLMFVLFLIRAMVIKIGFLSIVQTPAAILKLIQASYYDWMFAVAMGGWFIVTGFFLRNRINSIFNLYKFFIACILLTVFCALMNVKMVEMLGVPLNYQWL